MTNSFGLGTSTEIFLYESIAAWRVEAWYKFRHTLIFLMLDTAVAGDGLRCLGGLRLLQAKRFRKPRGEQQRCVCVGW